MARKPRFGAPVNPKPQMPSSLHPPGPLQEDLTRIYQWQSATDRSLTSLSQPRPVSVFAGGALDGNGLPSAPLAVRPDNRTIIINGNNQLEANLTAASSTVSVDPLGALDGDGSALSPLAVRVDGVTVTINGSNQLVSTGGSGISELTGDVLAGPGSGSQAATIPNDTVTYAKMQNVSAASRLLGRGSSGGAGDVEEITLGSGLTMTGTTLSSSGSGSGVVVQVVNTQSGAVQTGTTTIPLDDTIPQNTEGDEYFTLAITPTSSTNKLLIECVIMAASSLANWITVALFQDSTANALAAVAAYESIGGGAQIQVLRHYMTAGTTSSTTFKIRAGKDASAAGTVTINGTGGGRLFGGVAASSITITEIVP